MKLHILQQRFAEGIYQQQQDEILSYIQGNEDVMIRFDIYRNNVFSNLTNALKQTYSMIDQLMGETFFTYLAHAYIKQFPPTSGNLDTYGENFGAFLGSHAEVAEFPYLPDVAALEWACHQSFMAEEVPPFPMLALSKVAEEDQEYLCFTLHPSCYLLHSAFPLYRIWEVHQPGYEGEKQVDLTSGAHNLLIMRHRIEVHIHLLSEAEFHFLAAIKAGKTLYDAFEAAERLDALFDVGAYLTKCVTSDTFSDFKVTRSQCALTN